MNNNTVFIGTELKLNLHIEPIDGISMSQYDFEVEIFTSSKNVKKFLKKDCIKDDDDNYLILLDTSDLGVGEIKCKVTAYIDDDDFAGDGGMKDGFRTEVVGINTGIIITKDYE